MVGSCVILRLNICAKKSPPSPRHKKLWAMLKGIVNKIKHTNDFFYLDESGDTLEDLLNSEQPIIPKIAVGNRIFN